MKQRTLSLPRVMHRLRNRLIIAFAAATLIPLAGTLWIATALLDRSLAYTATQELDALSKSLELTAREFYQEARQNLKEDAAAGRRAAAQYTVTGKDRWPAPVQEFWESSDPERFVFVRRIRKSDRLPCAARRRCVRILPRFGTRPHAATHGPIPPRA